MRVSFELQIDMGLISVSHDHFAIILTYFSKDSIALLFVLLISYFSMTDCESNYMYVDVLLLLFNC